MSEATLKLKNYTSSVPVERTVARIEALLAACRARQVIKQFDDHGQLAALVFTINVDDDDLLVNLPANVPAVEAALLKMRPRRPMTTAQQKELKAQARRTAWKTVQELLEILIGRIQLGQAEVAEAFFPWIVVGAQRQTLYAASKATGFAQLGYTPGAGS